MVTKWPPQLQVFLPHMNELSRKERNKWKEFLSAGEEKNPKKKKIIIITAINAGMGLNLCQLFSIIYIN